ncbi:MAG TPA: hypothetical protein VNG90_03580 [Candidatus Acidoferrum sp.]|nr:hypothetical protein [Candidatus Acidoferrum sp.]
MGQRQRHKLLLCALCTFGFFATSTFLPPAAHATTGINQEISFEGKIVNASGINIADGSYNMEFKIYAGGTATGGGTLDWTEDWLVHNTQAVTVTSGTFQVNLGAVTAFGGSIDWNSNPLYLSMQIGNTSNCTITTTFLSNCGGDGEMSPYILLTSTPYALNSGELGGLTASQFLQLAPGSVQADSSTNSSVFVNKTGASGNILELQKAGTDVMSLSNTGALTLQNSADSTTALNVIGHTSGQSVLDVDTTNGRIGIGTAAPTAKVHVVDTQFTDNFNRSNSTNLGSNWTERSDAGTDFQIVSNQLKLTSVDASTHALSAYTSQGITGADYSVQSDLVFPSASDDWLAVFGRGSTFGTDDTQGYYAFASMVNQQVYIYKRNGGTWTQLGSSAVVSISSGTTYTIKLVMKGTSLYLYWNGVLKTSTTDSTFSSAGFAGVSIGSPYLVNSIWDNFSIIPTVPSFDLNDNMVVTGNGWIGVGTTSPSYAVDIQGSGDLNVTGVYRANGAAGSTTTCSGGQFLQNQIVNAGITVGGSCAAASNGVTTVGTFSGSSQTNGASIAGNTITFGPADATNPGMVSTGTQTFAGAKTVKVGSTSAFVVQNASAVNVLTVDTNTPAIIVGNDGTPSALTIRGGAATGTNVTGSNLTVAASNGTGTGGSGDLIFQTAAPSVATITDDGNDSTGSSSGTAVNSITFSHTIANQPNRIIVVGVSDNDKTKTVSTVTYAGVNLTKLDGASANMQKDCAVAASVPCHVELWYGVGSAAPVGTANVVITLGSSATAALVGGASSYYNVDQASPVGTSATITGTNNPSALSVSSNTTQLVVDVITSDNVINSPSAGQTQRFNPPFPASPPLGSSTKPGAASTTGMGWSDGASNYATVGVALNPPAGTTGDSLQDRLHVTAAGNVGINNSAPAFTLDVTGTGNFSTKILSPLLDTASAAVLNLGTTNATSISLNQNTSLAAGKNLSFTSGAGNFDQSSSTGTFATGTGAVSINGAATVASNKAFTANGSALFEDATNSSTAFQIQNAVATPIFLVDTTSTMANGNTLNYASYPDFESGSFSNANAGWASVAPGTLSQNTTKSNTYSGVDAAQVTCASACTGQGLTTSSFVSAPPTGTYIVSFYAKVSTGTMAGNLFKVATTGGAANCNPSASTTITSTGFQLLSCSVAPGATVTALSITQTDATARTFYVDAVQMQSNSYNGTTITSPTAFNAGGVQIRGTLTNPLAIAPNADSTGTFLVQNAEGTNVFTVDTLNGRLGIGTTAPTDSISIPAANSTISMGNGAGSQINMTGSPTSSSVFSMYGSSTETILNTLSGGDIALKVANATKVFMNSSGQLGLNGNTSPGATLDISSGGTIQGAGLSADCSTTNSKLLWSSSTKQFSCGTDRASATVRKTADQSVSASTTLTNDNALSFSIGASETWAYEIHFTTVSNTTADFKAAVAAPSGATCRFDVNNIYTPSSNSSTTCGAGLGLTTLDAADEPNYGWGVVVNGATPGTVQFQWAQNTSSGTSTVRANSFLVAFKLSGADLAEQYFSKDSSIQPGDVVAIDGSIAAGVKKTTSPYESAAIGIVSTEPGMVLGDMTQTPSTPYTPVLLALSGRIPVKVSTINGPIHAGDYLTTSSIPGVAMKATQAGQMIGKALEDYTDSNPKNYGSVMTFANLTWADPGPQALTNDANELANFATNDVLFKDASDSTSALQIQNTKGVSLLNADTKNMLVTVSNFTVSGTLTVNGHILTGGDIPITATLPAAGIDTTGANDSTCAIIGNDTNGTITITAGTHHLANGPECKVTYAKPFGTAPQPVFSALSEDATSVGMYINTSPTDMTIFFSHAPEASKSYQFNYWNPQ